MKKFSWFFLLFLFITPKVVCARDVYLSGKKLFISETPSLCSYDKKTIPGHEPQNHFDYVCSLNIYDEDSHRIVLTLKAIGSWESRYGQDEKGQWTWSILNVSDPSVSVRNYLIPDEPTRVTPTNQAITEVSNAEDDVIIKTGFQTNDGDGWEGLTATARLKMYSTDYFTPALYGTFTWDN